MLNREDAVAKGINFDRIVAELIMKMNRLQVGKRKMFKLLTIFGWQFYAILYLLGRSLRF